MRIILDFFKNIIRLKKIKKVSTIYNMEFLVFDNDKNLKHLDYILEENLKTIKKILKIKYPYKNFDQIKIFKHEGFFTNSIRFKLLIKSYKYQIHEIFALPINLVIDIESVFNRLDPIFNNFDKIDKIRKKYAHVDPYGEEIWEEDEEQMDIQKNSNKTRIYPAGLTGLTGPTGPTGPTGTGGYYSFNYR